MAVIQTRSLPPDVEIRDVWADNLEEAMDLIREVVAKETCYVAMDTEYPGVVARPIGSFTTSTDYQYQTLRCNVDLLRLIQLGMAFFRADGSYMDGVPVWQFNFKFSLGEDMYAQDSIEVLKQAGIDFAAHDEKGIEVARFGELLVPSGLVLMDNIKWVSFHGSSDFGYLLKVLTCSPLPAEEEQFFDILHTYFPTTFDLKQVALDFDKMGGLARLAEDLQVERIGTMHQAGSDALLTAATFFRMVEVFFDGKVENATKYSGHLYGLGQSMAMLGA
jgi:CCR4-NOT transcription complex subunit 7/8